MKALKWYLPLILVLTLSLSLSFLTTANALQIKLTDGTNTVIVADGDAADLWGTPTIPDGVVVWTGTVGVFMINVTTGTSKPAIGSAAVPKLDLNSINVSAQAGGTLNVAVTDTGYGPMATGLTGFDVQIGGTTEGSVLVDFYLDNTDAAFGTGTLLAQLGPFSGAFSGSASAGGPSINPFSLTIDTTITHTGAQTTSFDAFIRPIPEPGTILLFGIGLLGLGIISRRKLQVKG